MDFDTYARLEDRGEDFEFVLITNEFDAARLVSACDRRAPGRPLFDQVVHVNPAGVLAAYSAPGTPAQARSAATRLPELVSSGRLMSLASWLANVASYRPAAPHDRCGHCGRDRSWLLVLPEPQDPPAGGLKQRRVLEVALTVARDLRPPVASVRGRRPGRRVPGSRASSSRR